MDWPDEVALFETAAARAHAVLVSPTVGEQWAEPSVLPRLTVGGLAAHLVGVLRVLEHRVLDHRMDDAAPDGVPVVDPSVGYGVVRLRSASDLDEPVFAVVRDRANQMAGRGHAAIVDTFAVSLGQLVARLGDSHPDRHVGSPNAVTATTLRDYLVTRTVELVIHADDLAESVDVVVAPPGAPITDLVAGFLLSTVRHRLGDAEFLRALAGRRPPDVLRAL